MSASAPAQVDSTNWWELYNRVIGWEILGQCDAMCEQPVVATMTSPQPQMASRWRPSALATATGFRWTRPAT